MIVEVRLAPPRGTAATGGGRGRRARPRRRVVAGGRAAGRRYALVEDVGGEHEVPGRAVEQRLGLGPASRPASRACASFRSALAAVIATASSDQSVASTVPPASAAAMLGRPEPAAELERAGAAQRAAGDRAGERERARPQLGPVRQELLALERVLVEQRLGVARPQQPQVAAVDRDHLLDEVVHRHGCIRTIARTDSRVTSVDVARRAGVSQSTVSLVLSGKSAGRISARTEAAVRAAAEELGYRPNVAARALRTGTARTVGLVVTDVTHPFFGPVLRGAQAAAWRAGYAVALVDVANDPDRERRLVRGAARRAGRRLPVLHRRPARGVGRARGGDRGLAARACRSCASTPSAGPSSRCGT